MAQQYQSPKALSSEAAPLVAVPVSSNALGLFKYNRERYASSPKGWSSLPYLTAGVSISMLLIRSLGGAAVFGYIGAAFFFLTLGLAIYVRNQNNKRADAQEIHAPNIQDSHTMQKSRKNYENADRGAFALWGLGIWGAFDACFGDLIGGAYAIASLVLVCLMEFIKTKSSDSLRAEADPLAKEIPSPDL